MSLAHKIAYGLIFKTDRIGGYRVRITFRARWRLRSVGRVTYNVCPERISTAFM